jgi:predicted secreted hydrolase
MISLRNFLPLIVCYSIALVFAGTGAMSTHAADEEWKRVTEPCQWQFPRDHGMHPEYKTEWWYFTGNVQDKSARPFGYQLTIFRQGLQMTPLQKESRWAIRDFFFGHLAVSDIAGGKFFYKERVDRAALNQSGADTKQMNVWLQEWKIETVDVKREIYRLNAGEENMAVDLTLTPLKPLVLQGERGMSRKSMTPGNASNYYSYPRLQTEGTLRIGQETFAVNGVSWFDHEFSTSALGEEQAGWDWFSIELDSGCELMLYQMRNKNGTIDVASQGTWIALDGKRIELRRDDFQIEVLDTWKSPHSKAIYPSRWRLHIPRLKIELEVIAALRDQELYLMELSKIAYWEGACRISGTVDGISTHGVGYTELTGYSKAMGKF